MPSLIRFIIVLLFLAGIVYGGMIALVALVEPSPREMTERIPTTTLLGTEPGTAPARPGLPVPVTSAPANATDAPEAGE